MKNILISIGIFVVTILYIIFSIGHLKTVCDDLNNMDSQLEKYVNEEKWDKAYNSSMDIFNKWQKYSDEVSIFVNHAEIDNINNELWKLTQYVKCKNKDESLASIHVVKFLLEHIVNMEKVNIQNIF